VLSDDLLIVLLPLLIHDVEEPQLIHPLTGTDNPQPIPQLLLLQELLRQVLEISSTERDMRHDLDLPVSDLLDIDLVAEIARASLNLDAVVKEFLERRQVEDLVAYGLRAVDCVLDEESASARYI
jgi:hypothetical protein